MSKTMMLALVAAAAVTFAGCLTPADSETGTGGDANTPQLDAGATKTITIAIQPTDNADAIQDKATELEQFIEARMRESGVQADVKIIVPLTYVGAVEALRFGHADVAMMSAWPAVMANQKAGADVVLAEKREVVIDGQLTEAPYYYSYYVVPKDSPYQTLEDLRGKTVAYPSSTSTSGYVFPVAKLVEEGLVTKEDGKEADPKQFFGNVYFAGGYAQAWEAVKAGQADVALTAGDINAELFQEIMANSRIIETQGPIPSHAVVFSKDFQGEEREALKDAFLGLKGEKKALMRNLVSGIFVEFEETTTEKHTASLAGALKTAGLPFAEKIG